PIAFDRLVVLAAIRRRMPRRHRVVRELRDELLDRRLGIEPDLDRVRADEGSAEDASGQTRDVVALERFERGDGNLRGVRDLAEGDAAALAGLAKRAAETAGHPICSHGRAREPRLCYQPAAQVTPAFD